MSYELIIGGNVAGAARAVSHAVRMWLSTAWMELPAWPAVLICHWDERFGEVKHGETMTEPMNHLSFTIAGGFPGRFTFLDLT